MAASTSDRAGNGKHSAGWARRAEARSLALPPALLKEALANTKAVRDDVAFMAGLAREIALTRGSELTLAYRNVVLVMPGFRRRMCDGRARTTGQVCVVFVVRKKGSVQEGETQFLPKWLCVYAGQGKRRKVYAVPTDVQDASRYASVVPHACSGIWVRNGGWPTEDGSFACMVTLSAGGRSQRCVIGAQHVLTPYPDGSLRVAGKLDVLPLDTAGHEVPSPRLALTLPCGGVLRSDEREDRPSFDVQLAAVDPGGDIGTRVALRAFNKKQPWVKSMDALLLLKQASKLFLLPPENNLSVQGRGPLRVTLAAMPVHPYPIQYSFADGSYAVKREVFHRELLSFDAQDDGGPIGGDSGSPIVARWLDGTMTLVAMHIAGDGHRQSWAIPAWQLFDLEFWWQYPTGARIAPLDA